MFSKRLARFFILSSVVIAAFITAYSVFATVTLSNAPFAGVGGYCVGTNLDDSDMNVAAGFQTDASGQYLLDSVSSAWLANTTIDITMTLHADDGGTPGAAIATIGTLNKVANSVETLTFVPGAAITLEPSTTYWLVASSPSPDVWCPGSWTMDDALPSGVFSYVTTMQYWQGSWQERTDLEELGFSPPVVSLEVNATSLVPPDEGHIPGENMPDQADNGNVASSHANSHACGDNPGHGHGNRPSDIPPCR